MESGFDRSKRLRSGYSYKTNHSPINWKAKANKKTEEKPKTTKGWFFFGFLWALWICIFLIAYFIHTKQLSYHQVVANAFCITSGICFGLVLFWWSSRSFLFTHLSFFFFKVAEVTKLKRLKSMLHISESEPLYNHIETYDDYMEYDKVKKQNSMVACYVAVGLFSLLFFISLVVCFV